MITFEFDLQETIDEFTLNDSQVTEMCNAASQALTIEIHRQWGEEAKQALGSTRNSYLRGLIIRNEGKGENSVILLGKLNNMIESGAEPYDMKVGFAKSEKVKYTKAGNWYLTIPFRFATPGAIGESEVFDGVMPQEIYDIIKDKQANIIDGEGNSIQRAEALTNDEIPLQYQTPSTRASVTIASINKVFDSYTAKTNIYEGMIRNQKTYQEASQSTYNTFRRVSKNSSPDSWIHPGFTAKNLLDKGLANVDEDTLVNNVVDKILADYGF